MERLSEVPAQGGDVILSTSQFIFWSLHWRELTIIMHSERCSYIVPLPGKSVGTVSRSSMLTSSCSEYYRMGLRGTEQISMSPMVRIISSRGTHVEPHCHVSPYRQHDRGTPARQTLSHGLAPLAEHQHTNSCPAFSLPFHLQHLLLTVVQ